MLVDTIQAELVRLQIHPVNLAVTPSDDRLVALQGSLLQYWKIPETIDAEWFLGILQGLPDAAGPAAVMNAFCAAHASEDRSTQVGDSTLIAAQLDPATNEHAVRGDLERQA